MKKEKLAMLVSNGEYLPMSILSHGLHVDLVIADRRCPALDAIREHYPWLKTLMVERYDFSSAFNSQTYTALLLKVLLDNGITLVAKVGFKTQLAPQMFNYYGGRVLDFHPSLLPEFPGENAIEDALATPGLKKTGVTVYVDGPDLDLRELEVLAEESVRIVSQDTLTTLRERIERVGAEVYQGVIRQFMSAGIQQRGHNGDPP